MSEMSYNYVGECEELDDVGSAPPAWQPSFAHVDDKAFVQEIFS